MYAGRLQSVCTLVHRIHGTVVTPVNGDAENEIKPGCSQLLSTNSKRPPLRFVRVLLHTQADNASAWDSALALASPAAALLACCTLSGNSNRDDCFLRNDGDCGYPDWLRRGTVLADAAATTATDGTVNIGGRREGETAAAWAAKAKARAEAALRAARLVWTAVVISADYKAFDVSQVS